MKEPKTPDSEKIARIVAEAMTDRLVSAGAGLALAVGLGLMIRGDLVIGAVIFIIGLANFARMVQLWKRQ